MADGLLDDVGDRYGTFREQLGWMKSQVDSAPTKADLVALKADMKDFLRGELHDHEERLQAIVDKAFRDAAPGTEVIARRVVQEEFADRDRRKRQYEEELRNTPAYRKPVPLWAVAGLVIVAGAAGQVIMPIAFKAMMAWAGFG